MLGISYPLDIMGMDVSELNVDWVESLCLALKDKKLFRKDLSEWHSGEGPEVCRCWSGQLLSPEVCPGSH